MPNVKAQCRACAGKGQVALPYGGDPTKQECPKCSGHGYVQGWFVGKKDCSKCDTRGYIAGTKWYQCRDCEGKGYERYWVKKS